MKHPAVLSARRRNQVGSVDGNHCGHDSTYGSQRASAAALAPALESGATAILPWHKPVRNFFTADDGHEDLVDALVEELQGILSGADGLDVTLPYFLLLSHPEA